MTQEFTEERPAGEEAVLCRAIAEAPDEDTPRLVYADWLDEYRPDSPAVQAARSAVWDIGGREGVEPSPSARATLIRAQVEAARLPNHDLRRGELDHQADSLLLEHGERWSHPFRALRAVVTEYARGFPQTVLMYSDKFVQNGSALFDHHPTVVGAQVYHFPRGDDDPHVFVESPLFARLRELSIRGGNLGAAGLAALVDNPHVHRLEGLDLTSERVGDAGVVALASCTNLPNLRVLVLRDNGLTAAAATALASSSGLKNLISLALDGNRLGPGGRVALACSTALSGLQRLSVDRGADFARAVHRVRAGTPSGGCRPLPRLLEVNGRALGGPTGRAVPEVAPAAA